MIILWYEYAMRVVDHLDYFITLDYFFFCNFFKVHDIREICKRFILYCTRKTHILFLFLLKPTDVVAICASGVVAFPAGIIMKLVVYRVMSTITAGCKARKSPKIKSKTRRQSSVTPLPFFDRKYIRISRLREAN